MDISHVYKEVEKEIDLLNAKLANEANCQYELVQDIVQHIIHKGKRIRPVLLILLAKAFEINNFDAIINSSFAIELIHTASLLHDDVVDVTKKRRGKKTANTIWGNKETILVGDHLFSQSFLAIADLKNHDATRIIAQASSRLTIGEISQLANERNINLTKEQYLDVIYHKTASLFEASAHLGAMFSVNGNATLCGKFGKNIGFAFQIMDDLLDYQGSKYLNKDSGTDFKERKITLPILLLLEKEFEQKHLLTQYFLGNNDDFSFKSTVLLMKKNDICEECKRVMNVYVELARAFVLNEVSKGDIQKLLLDMLAFFTSRSV